MLKKVLIVVLLVGLLLPVLAGCSQTGGTQLQRDVVALVPKLTGNAFFEAANQGAQAYAQAQGFKVEYKGSPVASVENQIAIVEELIESKVGAISISALDPTALDAVLKKAAAAGIKVVTWDADVSGDARSLMVSQGTPEQLGRMLVEMAAKSLSERGKSPSSDAIHYVWHYSQSSVADQNSWQAAGEDYIHATYPNWVNVNADNYYSEQDADKALAVGGQILDDHPEIDLIICNDSTALPGQAQALQERGLTAEDITVTGFASPNAMRAYCEADIVRRWGLWDCQIQGALSCYLAHHLAAGNTARVGDKLDIPDIGVVEIMPNTVLDPDAYTAASSGIVLLPTRLEFTMANVNQYDF